jgi:MFS family permease
MPSECFAIAAVGLPDEGEVMRLLISFAALFLSVVLLQLSSGGVGPLDALTGLEAGFTASEVGFLGSAHFLGFFIGCWWAPRLMGEVGHSRAFATFTAMGAIGLAAHVLVTDPVAWAIMRMATGLCIAGCYTVIEAWLQAKVTNETRGRAMASYRIVDIGASLVAQLMIGALADLPTYIAYNILTILCCAAILPLAITRVPQPATPASNRLRPGLAWARSPLAVAGCIVSAVSGASFRMVGPIYGREVGLGADQIGLFLAAYVAGGALAQYPAGWFADKTDRRTVLIWLSVLSTLACVVTVTASGMGTIGIMLAAGLFGMTTVPIYSVSSAHAHDFASDDERVELSAALMFYYAVGAIAAPWMTSALIGLYGPASLFAVIAIAHVGLIVFGLIRMRKGRTAPHRTAYVYAPRTTFWFARLLGRDKGGDER